jgi:hypothetical protein
MTGIYKITETATGKCYIGQSVCIERRWKQHHKNFSPDAHTYELLMTCTVEALDRMERFFIQAWDTLAPSGLNRTTGGWGKFGYMDEETRHKLSEKLIGNKRAVGHTPFNKGKTKLELPQLSNAGRKVGSVGWNKGIKTGPLKVPRKDGQTGIKRGPYKKREA